MNIFNNKQASLFYTDNDRKELLSIIEDCFGKNSCILHEILSDNNQIDIAVIPPTNELNFYKLFTIGMGSKEMNIPSEFKKKHLERAEVCMFISPECAVHIKHIEQHWTVNFLKTITNMPFEQNTWIGHGHSVQFADFNAYGGFNGALLISLQSEEKAIVTDSQKRVNFYLTIPLYTEEINYKNDRGCNAILDLFDNNAITPVVDFNRKNCCI